MDRPVPTMPRELGEDNAAVFGEFLGYRAADLEGLREKGAI